MANHKSAAKRARQAVKRNTLNRARRSQVHTLMKGVDEAIGRKDAKGAVNALHTAEACLARAAGRTMHWRTAARKTSRLAKRVKKASSAKA